MDRLARKRIIQLFQYGWPQAKEMAKQLNLTWAGKFLIFWDMVKVYCKYHIWSNQYKKENFYTLGADARKEIGENYKKRNDYHDNWILDYYDNKKFINKYTSKKWYISPSNVMKRQKAYTKRYNAGEGLVVANNVILDRNHFLNGTIILGKNVMLSKNVYIDYSGNVVLCDDVKLSSGVTIESHAHEFVPGSTEYKAIPTSVFIEDGVWVGQHAVICESVKKIGRYAQIGAGAVVRNSIPPYAIVIGNPAKIVGFVFTSEQVEVFEKQHFPDNPIDLEKYEADYQKCFINKMNEIKQYIKL